MPKPSLSDLSPEFAAKAQKAENPHLAIEALRDLLTEESASAPRATTWCGSARSRSGSPS